MVQTAKPPKCTFADVLEAMEEMMVASRLLRVCTGCLAHRDRCVLGDPQGTHRRARTETGAVFLSAGLRQTDRSDRLRTEGNDGGW